MSEETADRIFSLLKNTGCHSVHIGGGEPFINFDKLLGVCKSAYRHNISIDYIETNASWYTDDLSVSKKLQKLMSVGVDCLLVSVDPFHNEFIPYIKVKNLLKLCRKNGMGTFVWQSKYERIVQQLDENTTHSLKEYEDIFGDDFVKMIAESYAIGYNGRALQILEKNITSPKDRKPYDYFFNENKNKCGEKIKSLHHFHIDINGDLIPPSCNGFKANIFDLCENGLDNEKYKYFLSIINGGLGELFDKSKVLGFAPKTEGYLSKCELCFDIKKYICENITKETGTEPPDIGPVGFFYES